MCNVRFLWQPFASIITTEIYSIFSASFMYFDISRFIFLKKFFSDSVQFSFLLEFFSFRRKLFFLKIGIRSTKTSCGVHTTRNYIRKYINDDETLSIIKIDRNFVKREFAQRSIRSYFNSWRIFYFDRREFVLFEDDFTSCEQRVRKWVTFFPKKLQSNK